MIGRQVGTDGKGSGLGVKYKSVTASLLCAASLLTFSAATSPTPIKLAIFDFELEDSSAGSLPTAETSSDTRQLASLTNEVRQLFAQSGRYRLVDMAGGERSHRERAHAARVQ